MKAMTKTAISLAMAIAFSSSALAAQEANQVEEGSHSPETTSVRSAEVKEVKNEEVKKATTSRKKFSEKIKNNLNAMGEIKGIQELPVDKLMFVEAEKGIYFVTGDGRFVIQGTMQDVWHRKHIDSLDDARDTLRTPLSNMNFDPLEQLPAWRVGNPDIPRQGLVFVDPTSAITQQFLQQVIAEKEKYHFVVALLPLVGGEKAMDRAKRLHCAKDRELALIDLANYTNESTGELRPDCNAEKIMFGAAMTQVFRIEALPHFVREDGLVSKGLPEDLDKWLERQ